MQLQIGIKIFLRNPDGELLFIRRADSPTHDVGYTWDIPGGRVEANEALMQALARELSEEVGFAGTYTPELIDAQDIFVTTRGLHIVRLTYSADVDKFTPRLSHEHTEAIWKSKSEMMHDPLLDEITRGTLLKI